MSKFHDRFKAPVDDPAAFSAAVEHLIKDYPEVCAVLTGEVDSGGNWTVKPFSVRLFINGGVLKFQISRSKERLSGWGEIRDGRDVLKSIEEALSSGKVGWKAESEQNPSY